MVTKSESARGVGEVVGEMALFNGGTRGASLVATQPGFLAVFQFEELVRLRKANDEQQKAIARKLNGQLAHAALAKQLEASGETLSEWERQERIVDLRLRQVEQHWETGGHAANGGGGGDGAKHKGGETLLKRLNKIRKGSTHALAIVGAAPAAMGQNVAGGGGKKGRPPREEELADDIELEPDVAGGGAAPTRRGARRRLEGGLPG